VIAHRANETLQKWETTTNPWRLDKLQEEKKRQTSANNKAWFRLL